MQCPGCRKSPVRLLVNCRAPKGRWRRENGWALLRLSAGGGRDARILPARSRALAADLYIFSIYEEENFMFSPIEASNYYLMVFHKSRDGEPR